MLRPSLALAVAAALLPSCGGTFRFGPRDAGTDADAQLKSDKVDILFMIDNSTSMGTKQDVLRQTVPDFLDRLLAPPCVSPDDERIQVPRTSATCPAGYVDLYKPLTDIHVGVITSALGGGGAEDVCRPDAMISPEDDPVLAGMSRHNDDRGHLINRKKPDRSAPPPNKIEDPVPGALPASFLAWLPPVPENAGKPPPAGKAYGDRRELYTDFGELVRGAQEWGCGLEAQLESVYRFLVQPDPWDHIVLDRSQVPAAAQLAGIDPVVLKQRHDFLRPDSIVAVVFVTDEEDSWTDPMWQGGRGWLTRANKNNFSTDGRLPRGTLACTTPVDPSDPSRTGPNDPHCQWCAFVGTETDPNCAIDKGLYGPGEDGPNVRYTNDMKRRYGMDPQFPIERYVDGLTSLLVPDRFGEHPTTDGRPSNAYVGSKTCTNPLFAQELPTDPNAELCRLERGPRDASLVFLAVIPGVPWQLLTTDPKKGGAFKTSLDDADWRRILGKDPATYQDEGIDPHMIESIAPRAIPCGPTARDDCDPVHGREWDTLTSRAGIDLQYACTFPLPVPVDCSKAPDTALCDCGVKPGKSTYYTGPLCAPNPNDDGKPTLQLRGRAYPGIRELRVARKLGPRAAVGSICPRSIDPGDPDYGQRPALRALVEHMRVAFR